MGSPPASSSMPEQPRASRLLVSVRRSITPRRHAQEDSTMIMYSTRAESRLDSHPPSSASFRDLPSATARPTVEQIAMGLHVSRTPHLRHHARSTSHASSTPSLPRRSSLKKQPLASSSATVSDAPPALHSLPLPTAASASTSTVTTSVDLYVTGTTLSSGQSPSPRLPPQHHHQNQHSSGALSALKSRMARLLPGERKRSASAPPGRPRVSVSTDRSAETLNTASTPSSLMQKRAAAARKAVRFEES